ncbi:MAG: LysR family transcriptional regulator [Calditrichia bacterium]
MELLHLRTFVVVAEEENLTRAAQRLYLTPPTVSGHIKALEDELNVTLFIRSSTGMQLTEKGELLKQKALATLQAAQNMVNHATELQEHLIGSVQLGLNAPPLLLRVPQLITTLESACPGIKLQLTSSSTGKLLKDLQSGKIDLSYIFDASPYQDIETIPLENVDLSIAIPASWGERITGDSWEELAAFPWVCSDGYCPSQSLIDERFSKLGLEYDRVVMSDDERTKLDLVRDGVGISLLEHAALTTDIAQKRIVIWEHQTFSAKLHFAYSTSRKNEPLLRALLPIVKNLWQV